ncbi:CUB and zona pellucida-like domain-containing protein 1 [Hyperolius riggenbachi]|uniref:CUB and zona pellucida-like domain-containing protein 1 n=1 Tax=Hyperolius riggenbachi TaxID=752182 RepID=UPI0035A3CE30
MALIICIVFLVLPCLSSADSDSAPSENRSSQGLALRLVNGSSPCAGRVEIYFREKWGTVCDDYWSLEDAAVVCRQMGCGKAVSFHMGAYFGQGANSIVLDDVRCLGNETELWNCPHRGVGITNCNHAEDAGVTCSGSGSSTDNAATTTPTTTPPRTTTASTYRNAARTASTARTTAPSTTLTSATTSNNNPTSGITTLPSTTTILTTAGVTEITTTTSTTTMASDNPTTTTTDIASSTTYSTTPAVTEITTTSAPTMASDDPTTAASADIVSSTYITTPASTTTAMTEATTTTSETTTTAMTEATTTTSETATTAMTEATTTTSEATTTAMSEATTTTSETTTTAMTEATTTTSEATTTAMTEATTTTTETTTTAMSEATTTTTETTTTASTTPSTNYTCGGVLNQSSGTISSPSYPNHYPPNSLCTWVIQTEPNTFIHLHMYSIDFGSNPTCDQDYLTLHDGNPDSPVLEKICREGKQFFASSSNVLTLRFRSDGSRQSKGFMAEYNSIRKEPPTEVCGGIMTDPQGIIFSPSTLSHETKQCIWYINVAHNNTILLHFSSFKMKHSLSCASFSMAIYDGTPMGSGLLGRPCDTTARDFTSSSNSLSIVYNRLDDHATDEGFELSATYTSLFANNKNVTLSCSSDYMEARISVSYLQFLGHSPENLYLNDPQCRPRVSSDWLEFIIPYQKCQTVKQAHNDTIVYGNTLFTHSTELKVTYRKKLSLTLRCQMYRDTVVEALYFPEDVMESNVDQYGLYFANLAFYQSSAFMYPVSQYPYYVSLGQPLYLQATLETSDPTLVMFVDTCLASPDPIDTSRNVFYVRKDGCSKVPDYKTYASTSGATIRFGFNAFSFLKQYSSVYIQCKLVVCKKYDEQSRCNKGCMSRKKRDLGGHHEHVHAVAGPLKLKEL